MLVISSRLAIWAGQSSRGGVISEPVISNSVTNGKTELTIYPGACEDWLPRLEAESVHCVVTSPPYWGLRDYGCKGQLGLEKTPAGYVARVVEIFRQVRRVLRKDGTLWLNMGDCYAQNRRGAVGKRSTLKGSRHNANESRKGLCGVCPAGMKSKDLIGLPWRVAFALQADGWWLRTEIIWHKNNPMPESVRDRPTRAHEYIFLLSRSERYYYDAEAIQEEASPNTHARIAQAGLFRQDGGSKTEAYQPLFPGKKNRDRKPVEIIQAIALRNRVHPKAKMPGVNSRIYQDRDPNHSVARKIKQNGSFSAAVVGLVLKRNKRTVWTVGTAPYKGAHFATYPPALIEPCILAGCPAGGTVLDPFAGSGTTGEVALRLGRSAVLIEMKPEYVGLIKERIEKLNNCSHRGK